MKKTSPLLNQPVIVRTHPRLVVSQKPLENALNYLYRHSHRYGFEPKQGSSIAGYVENNALYLAINASKHLVCSLNRGSEPRVTMGRLDIEPLMQPDAYVWVSKNAHLPFIGDANGAVRKQPFVSSSRLHAHMREVRVKTKRETAGASCDVLVSREFPREFSSLSLEIVHFRV